MDTGSSRTLLAAEIFFKLVKLQHRTSLLSPSNLGLQSVTGHRLTVLGKTQIKIDTAGCLDVYIVQNLPNEMILGIDAISKGEGTIDFPRRVFHWFNRQWPLLGEKKSQIIGTLNLLSSTSSDIQKLISQFSHIFSDQNSKLTPCKLQPIPIITEGEPICQRAYRTPLLKRKAISEAIDDMLAQGIIRPSCSPWASPVTLVPKPDGSIRFCVDYRKLNQVTRKDRYPLPQVADVVDGMQGTSIFSTIDLKSGFHQILVNPEDCQKTAFICHRGLFEFVRMPFGLANGPAHFQRVMDIVFRDLLGVCVMVYIDDIVIYSKNMNEHLKHLELVFDRLAFFGLQIKAEKCHFALPEIKLLGFVLNRDGIKANPDKTSAIASMPPPRTVKQVRSFLGMTGYYRQCIPGYASLAEPLNELTKKRSRFHWSSQCQSAFEGLKKALISDSVVRYPRIDLPYRLYTDASDSCVGAILCQTHEDGVEYVVQYVSHQLSTTQRRWATIEKEAYAVVYALQKLRPYLYGADFVVYTDHKPLLCLFSKSLNNTKIQRWAILLAEYGATIKYRPGSNNIRADMLSRLPPAPVSAIDSGCEYTEPPGEPADIADDLLPFTMDGLDRKALSAAQQAEFPNLWGKGNSEDSGYVINRGILYSIWTPSTTSPEHPRIVLPPPYQEAVIDRAHHEVGHLATQKTLGRLREAYVWPHMRESVKARLNKCATCTVHNPHKDHVAMGDMPLPVSPMQVVALDLIGPFVASSRNNKYVLTVIDHCSGWAEAYPIPDKRSQTIEHVFHNCFVAAHGCPESLISDNGAEFTARHWTDYLSRMGIKHVRCTPQHPESNGKIERFNRTFKSMLAKAVNNSPGDWEDHVGSTLFSHRISISDVTHYSPFYLLYGRQPRAPLSRLLHVQDTIQGFGSRMDSLSKALKEARTNTEGARRHNKARLAQKANDGLITPGDMVVLLAPEPLTLTSKWDPQWQVTRVSGTTIFLRHQQSGKTKKVHRSKVKLVDPNIVWDEVAPRPRRQQRRGGQNNVTVNIQVDTPPTRVPLPQDPPGESENTCSRTPQASEHDISMDTEPEASETEHPPNENGPVPTPVILSDVQGELVRARPMARRLPVERESERVPAHGQKRAHSPSSIIVPRHNTRWSSLSDEDKRKKRIRYDVLAGRMGKFSNVCGLYTVE